MLQKEGQQREVMSAEDAATLGYFIMVIPGRLVFRTAFGGGESEEMSIQLLAFQIDRQYDMISFS